MPVRQSLNFFYKCRCYLLLFTEICMNTYIYSIWSRFCHVLIAVIYVDCVKVLNALPSYDLSVVAERSSKSDGRLIPGEDKYSYFEISLVSRSSQLGEVHTNKIFKDNGDSLYDRSMKA